MSQINGFDELNIINEQEEKLSSFKLRSMPFDQYFGEMELTDEQKDERIAFAEALKPELLYIFALIDVMSEHESIDEAFLVAVLYEEYLKAIVNIDADSYITSYVNTFAQDFINTTVKHMDEAYYTSDDRATYVAENEANSIENYGDYTDAAAAGYTKKKWVTMHDAYVRDTHSEAEGEIVGINEPFVVGDSLLMFPKDTSLGADASEIVNCRCSVEYIK